MNYYNNINVWTCTECVSTDAPLRSPVARVHDNDFQPITDLLSHTGYDFRPIQEESGDITTTYYVLRTMTYY